MSKLKSFTSWVARHKYIVTFVAFIALIGYIDDNSLYCRMEYNEKISELKTEIDGLRQQYDDATNRLNLLKTNREEVRRVARERYYMHTADEEVFVFEANHE